MNSSCVWLLVYYEKFLKCVVNIVSKTSTHFLEMAAKPTVQKMASKTTSTTEVEPGMGSGGIELFEKNKSKCDSNDNNQQENDNNLYEYSASSCLFKLLLK